jgi:hypothetical protein
MERGGKGSAKWSRRHRFGSARSAPKGGRIFMPLNQASHRHSRSLWANRGQATPRSGTLAFRGLASRAAVPVPVLLASADILLSGYTAFSWRRLKSVFRGRDGSPSRPSWRSAAAERPVPIQGAAEPVSDSSSFRFSRRSMPTASFSHAEDRYDRWRPN